MNKDQIKGHIKNAKGTLEEAAGKVSGNENLEQKGELHKVAGKVQTDYGDIKADVKEKLKKD